MNFGGADAARQNSQSDSPLPPHMVLFIIFILQSRSQRRRVLLSELEPVQILVRLLLWDMTWTSVNGWGWGVYVLVEISVSL